MDTTTNALIEKTQQALQQVRDPEEAFTLQNYLVTLYRQNGNREDAVTLLEDIIVQYLENPHKDADTLAALHNNLGLLLQEEYPKKAIEAFREADRYYRENEKENPVRIAGVNYQLSQLYTRLNDSYYIKKYLRETIAFYERAQTEDVFEARARAHNQLALIYSDKLMLFDAKNHFHKALETYMKIYTEGDRDTAMIIGGILNNLGVTYRELESFFKAEEFFTRTLEFYEGLETGSSGYLPWIGATLTNLSNLYAENEKTEAAITYAGKALRVYEHLSKTEPALYSHYLATSLHNLGLHHMDRDPAVAEDYFRKAISIREDLAKKEPHAFNADLAASLMNLVELYHSQWEDSLRKDLKDKSMALLKMVQKKAPHLPQNIPAVKNILSDLHYYTERFNNEDLSGLHFLKMSRENMRWKEEVNATIVPAEKIPYQQKVVTGLRKHVQKYPGHYRGMEAFSDALSELAWFCIRNGKFKKAAALLGEMRALPSDLSPEAKCNLAHYYLLSGNELKALEFYKQVLPLKNEDQKPMKETLLKDLDILEGDGVLKSRPQALESLLNEFN